MEITDTFTRRALWVLGRAFRGLHHISGSKIKWYTNGTFQHCEYSTVEELATYDADHLTRLVIAAHDACIRLAISHSGPYMVKIKMWPRACREDGHLYERHPTIEQAIKTMREGEWPCPIQTNG